MLRPDWIDHPEQIPDPLGHGARAVAWLRRLRHPKNPAPGHPFTLDPWQEAVVKAIYGPRHPDGSRIVRRAFLVIPRGNRKTSLCAALTLLHLAGPERQPGGLVLSAASARDQARELFQEAALVVSCDARLSRLKVQDTKSTIAFPELRTRYTALSARGNAHHGKTPNVIIADEALHTWNTAEGKRLWDALELSLVKTPGTLLFVASTAGRGQDNLGHALYDYARKVQIGEIDDPATLPVIFAADREDDPWSEEVWHAVNPGMAHGYPDAAAYRDKARKSQLSSVDRESFLQYNLNVWLDSSTSPFVDMPNWDRCRGEVDLLDMAAGEIPCWIGVDLSKTNDLTAVVACFRDGNDFYLHPMAFCPEDALRRRGEQHGVDYVDWAAKGHIITTPGAVIDLAIVEDYIRELCATYNVREVAADPMYAKTILARLTDDGIPAVEHRQGWVSMAPAVQAFERAIISEALHHDGNPVMRWNISNVQI